MPKPFDFRQFLSQFEFSVEAKRLYNTALEIFKFYHKSLDYKGKNYNDSYYDIVMSIMGNDNSNLPKLEDGKKRIAQVKTTKGIVGFSRNNYKKRVDKKYHPIFEEFFDARDSLARKINKELVDSHLLLWERENIY